LKANFWGKEDKKKLNETNTEAVNREQHKNEKQALNVKYVSRKQWNKPK